MPGVQKVTDAAYDVRYSQLPIVVGMAQNLRLFRPEFLIIGR